MEEEVLKKIEIESEELLFQDVISYIESKYKFTPTSFQNGDFSNNVGQNSGSCKIFYFGKTLGLSKTQVLNCFGDYYREEVLKNPDADNHANIRNFIKFGWDGINFDGEALISK